MLQTVPHSASSYTCPSDQLHCGGGPRRHDRGWPGGKPTLRLANQGMGTPGPDEAYIQSRTNERTSLGFSQGDDVFAGHRQKDKIAQLPRIYGFLRLYMICVGSCVFVLFGHYWAVVFPQRRLVTYVLFSSDKALTVKANSQIKFECALEMFCFGRRSIVWLDGFDRVDLMSTSLTCLEINSVCACIGSHPSLILGKIRI